MFKKSIFAPLFIIFTAVTLYLYVSILNQYLEIFFKPYGGLAEFSILSVSIIFISLTYALFVTLAQEFKIVLIPIILTSLIPFAFLSTSLSIVITIGLLISFTLSYFNLQTNLKTYVNFSAPTLLTSPIKILNTFLLLTLAAGYFLHTNSLIQTQGFKIPDAIIEWAVDLSLKNQNPPVLGVKYLAQLPNLTTEQLNLLKQNPQILEQYGLSADDLDNFTPTSSQTSPNKNSVSVIPSIPGANLKDIVKAQISNMLDELIKPYLFIIPIILAFMFYSLGSLTLWILSLFLSPIISLVFYLLEKSNFIKFTTETRVVKKLIT